MTPQRKPQAPAVLPEPLSEAEIAERERRIAAILVQVKRRLRAKA